MWKGRPQLVPEVVELDWNRATIPMPMSLAAEGRQPTEASHIPIFISEQLAYMYISIRDITAQSLCTRFRVVQDECIDSIEG